MEDLKRVYVTQDDDGHNYVIPFDLLKSFNETREKIFETKVAYDNNFCLDTEEAKYDAETDFDMKFSQYATGGDINLIELYARI